LISNFSGFNQSRRFKIHLEIRELNTLATERNIKRPIKVDIEETHTNPKGCIALGIDEE
jgi:hypothetical protein